MSRSDTMPSILSPSALMMIAPIRSSFMRWIADVMEESGRMVTTRLPLDFRMLATFMGRLSAPGRGHRRGTRAPPRGDGNHSTRAARRATALEVKSRRALAPTDWPVGVLSPRSLTHDDTDAPVRCGYCRLRPSDH